MKKICYLTLLLCFTLVAPLSVNLLRSTASIENRNRIVVGFRVEGGSPPYSITYLGIPQEWSTRGNSLIINKSNSQSSRTWIFDILVKDSSGT